MDLGIAGRNALVCASTSGIGLGIARALGDEGVRVAITGRRVELAREEAGKLPSAAGVGVDLEELGAPESLVREVVEALGEIDILVLNSGGPAPGTAREQTTASLESAIRRLLLPQQALVALVLPGMIQRGWGRILAVGSSSITQPLPGLAASNVGRAALAGYLKTLANEVAGEGVTVNMVLPGRIATERLASLDEHRAQLQGVTVDELRTVSYATIPVGRYGTPDEFGAMAAFLCSEQASYVTGTHVRVDGGLVRGF